MRAQYLIMLFGTGIALWQCKEKKIDLLKLIFYGFFIFYIFWEIKSRYIIALYPLMGLLSFIGYMLIFKKKRIKNSKVDLSHDCLAFHHIIPDHHNNGCEDFSQHIVQSNFFNKKPHQKLVDTEPYNTGSGKK